VISYTNYSVIKRSVVQLRVHNTLKTRVAVARFVSICVYRCSDYLPGDVHSVLNGE
jgi:hypothetical protein